MATGDSLPPPRYEFGVWAACSELHAPDAVRALCETHLSVLRALGGALWDGGAMAADAPLVVLVATGGTERLVLERLEQRPEEPALLVAHPSHNSLPATLEIAARMSQDHRPCRLVYVPRPDDEHAARALCDAVADARASKLLGRCRLGMVGAPSDWLVASSPAPQIVRETWGPEVIPIDHEELLGGLEEVTDADLVAGERAIRQGATGVVEPDEAAIRDAARVSAALRTLVGKHRLDGLTVRCFDLVTRKRTTACMALAELADEGIVAGCEGDLPSALTMLWLRAMFNRTSWMANPSRLGAELDELWLAHCTVPRSLVGPKVLRSHFESGLGVAIEGSFALGPVTLVRVGGRDLRSLWTAQGLAMPAAHQPDLCRTQLRVKLERAALESLLRAPLGNHLVVMTGHHAPRLRAWHEWLVAGRGYPPLPSM